MCIHKWRQRAEGEEEQKGHFVSVWRCCLASSLSSCSPPPSLANFSLRLCSSLRLAQFHRKAPFDHLERTTFVQSNDVVDFLETELKPSLLGSAWKSRASLPPRGRFTEHLTTAELVSHRSHLDGEKPRRQSGSVSNAPTGCYTVSTCMVLH